MFGAAEGRECFYPTALPRILLTGTTYTYLLSSKHDPSPQDRQYALSSKRKTETGAQLSHLLCCRGSLGLSGGIRCVLYTEDTNPGLVLHRYLCPGPHTCAWKIPTPDFSITEPSAQRDRFFSNKKALSLQIPYYIFSKYIYAPTQTLQLKALQC